MPNSQYKVPDTNARRGSDAAAEHAFVRKQANAKGAQGQRPGTWGQEKEEMLRKRTEYNEARKKKQPGENMYRSTQPKE